MLNSDGSKPSYGFYKTPVRRSSNMLNQGDHTSTVLIDHSHREHRNRKEDESKDNVSILCFDLTHVSPAVQFFILTFGIFFFYLLYGYVQELIFRLEGFRPYGWYLTLVQFGCYSLFGLVELYMKADRQRRIPLPTYGFLAFLTVATMGLSNSSLGYLNYPTQVIFKCCKLIPVLVGGIIIQGKKYGVIDVSACLSMSIGLILFTLADSTVSPNFNSYGILLISLALCADAVIGNVQEKTMKEFKSTNSEMVLYSYSIGFVYILFGLVISGQLFPAFNFCLQYPVETYGYGAVFSLTGYLGVNIVLTMVKTFGALIAVTVTTCRKALTIVLSFIFFAKPFTFQYLWAGLIVLLGIYLNIYSKNKTKWDPVIREYLTRLNPCRKRDIQLNNMENIV
ncbi:adenosine 3'-phospho 5'-phosphosulfate transporter 2 [Lingula anatina]|uniref:Adenosine 3'-phospho 5'-phosphosulfate transporter 2 n=1 Tax=Lingula anatina TaxID=7574 RepID=A0A1S3J8P5_LINAN|nr:adenosine 3'-phospho 5'-phosphosulfate transporter 2 [Lingula anatina]|eukprot:XP_013406770.1 adenosine 3'-phospho 5'-phosphosulfate transporter 2 [Lingula anatina]